MSQYGSLILSEAELLKQRAIEIAGANTYGPLVIGVTAAQAEAQALAEFTRESQSKEPHDPGQVRATDAVKALAENPASFTDLLAAELAREEPRISVLKALKGAADDERSGATDEQSAALTALLT